VRPAGRCRSESETATGHGEGGPAGTRGLTRRDFLLGAVGAGLLLGRGRGEAARGSRPRNLILIVSDTLRADRLGCYGASFGVTPHMDALARRGTRFANYFTCASLTGASHASMMTGTYQTRHSITGLSGTITKGLKTIASVCRAGGCQTAGFVSNGVLVPSNLAGIERGFDRYDATDRDGPTTVGLATRWLREHNRRPFFLWVHLMEPHGPYTPVDEAAQKHLGKLHRKGDPPVLPMLPEQSDEGPGGIPNYQMLGEERDPAVYRGRYTAKAALADTEIGKLLREVHQLGLDGSTAIALTSDHGEMLGERNFYFQHGVTLHQAVVHVPLIISGPGLPQGATLHELAGSVDVMPTLLDLLELRDLFPQQLQGQSLLPLLRGNGVVPPVPRYGRCDYQNEQCIYVGTRKYSERDEGGGRVGRLVDWTEDPAELHDLSAAHRAEMMQLRARLEEMGKTRAPVSAQKGAPRPTLSAEQRRKLKALGYLK
jgi:arylsulfatase A-like enzyme